jgi:hypothetical protein
VTNPAFFTIRINSDQELFNAYYFFSRHSIHGPERPMTKTSAAEFSSLLFLQDSGLISDPYDILTIRVYTNMNSSEGYVDFENTLSVQQLDIRTIDIQLTARKNFYQLQAPTFIGTYNPFVIDADSHQLVNYFLGHALGSSHKIIKVGSYCFEITPVLYAPIDIEEQRDEILKRNIPFIGYQSIEDC